MIADAAFNYQSGSGNGQDDPDTEIIVIAPRLSTQPGSGGSGNVGGGLFSIIVNRGGINAPTGPATEFLRALTTDATDFDLDPSFTPKQREIILKAIRGLAEHPTYAAKMVELLAKGADVNIVADYSGDNTGPNGGLIRGKNKDGTVDRGESMTIYINMNYGSAPTSDTVFATTIVHELIHAFGDPSLDALLDAPGSEYDRGPFRDIFSGYSFQAPAGSEPTGANIISVPAGGGALAGVGEFAVFDGSSFADRITPGSGGGIVYSGGGDDQIVLTAGAAVAELADSGGNDTIEVAAGTLLTDVSLRWSSDGSNLSVLVNGTKQLVVLDASGSGAVEHISVAGSIYDLSSLPQTTNQAPIANEYNSLVEGSFFGGYVGNGSAFDPDGDQIGYTLEMVTGELAEAMWTVDPVSGAVYGDFTRMEQTGSAYSFVTILANDGIETVASTLTIRWGNGNELPTSFGTAVRFASGDERATSMSFPAETMMLGGDPGWLYVL